MSDLRPLDPDAVVGCLLGQAVGDMMGLPMENLSARRVAKLFPNLDRPRFLFGYGMGSDDTEHACMTARAIPSPWPNPLRVEPETYEAPMRFEWNLRWALRGWFLAGPPGIGRATLLACLKMMLFIPRSGVYSAGNGPAMRAAVIGVANAMREESWRADWVRDSTLLTHTDPKALVGALAVACAAALAVRSRDGASPTVAGLLAEMTNDREYLIDDTAEGVRPAFEEFERLLMVAEDGVRAGDTVAQFAARLQLTRGVSGYMFHTVPVALFAFLRHPDDYRTAIESVIRLGGDTDTVAAITGALVGARVGKAGIPKEWLDRHTDCPWSVRVIERTGVALAKRMSRPPRPRLVPTWGEVADWAGSTDYWSTWSERLYFTVFSLLRPLRNLLFFLVVLVHASRRLLPPY